MSFVTFIVPSCGRPSLRLSLASLEAQGDQDWEAIVVFDGVKPTVDPPPKMKFIEVKKHGHPYGPRNEGLKFVESPWVAFLDDDDRLLTTYVERLKYHVSDVYEVILFSILLGGNRLYPPSNRFIRGLVGMSFAVNMDFVQEEKPVFIKQPQDDFLFLKSCKEKGARIKCTNEVQYLMRTLSNWKRPNFTEQKASFTGEEKRGTVEKWTSTLQPRSPGRSKRPRILLL